MEVVTLLMRCPRARWRSECDDIHAGRAKVVWSQSATCIMTFFATFLLHTVSRSRCSRIRSRARGSHVQNVIQTLPVLLDVVGCRVGRQLSVVVMVHKARVYMLSLRFLVSDG